MPPAQKRRRQAPEAEGEHENDPKRNRRDYQEISAQQQIIPEEPAEEEEVLQDEEQQEEEGLDIDNLTQQQIDRCVGEYIAVLRQMELQKHERRHWKQRMDVLEKTLTWICHKRGCKYINEDFNCKIGYFVSRQTVGIEKRHAERITTSLMSFFGVSDNRQYVPSDKTPDEFVAMLTKLIMDNREQKFKPTVQVTKAKRGKPGLFDVSGPDDEEEEADQ